MQGSSEHGTVLQKWKTIYSTQQCLLIWNLREQMVVLCFVWSEALSSVCMECVLSRSVIDCSARDNPLFLLWHFNTRLENLHWLYWTLDQILISWLDSIWRKIPGGIYKIHSCPNKAKLLISSAGTARKEKLIVAITAWLLREAEFTACWDRFLFLRVLMIDSVDTAWCWGNCVDFLLLCPVQGDFCLKSQQSLQSSLSLNSVPFELQL